jgi:hypothetical protein
MINPVTQERELAYIVTIDEIKPIPNYDRVEHARVGGWWVIVRKNQFQVGDLAIYIEIDSKVPEKEPFMFLEQRHFKVKTLKMCKVISQGLLMSPEDFNWDVCGTRESKDKEWVNYIEDEAGKDLYVGDFLTQRLGITYADAADNKRKAPSVDKYKKMAQRRPKIFKTKFARWMMKREWGKKVMFFFFGKKKDKKNGWPAWVSKTDEERCQNMPWLFPGTDEEWIATEKIDGTSTTFTLKGKGRKSDFRICSRNVVFDKPDKKCFYETNVYTEMAVKYNIEEVLKELMNSDLNPIYVTIQGETYGEKIQKRDYGLKEHNFMAFNVIFGMPDGRPWRLNPIDMTDLLTPFGIPCVPIVDEHFLIPETCDELLALAGGASKVDGGMREGLVFRSYDGVKSFKAVDPEFLLKYHQ